jgi:hypothetical protein
LGLKVRVRLLVITHKIFEGEFFPLFHLWQ